MNQTLIRTGIIHCLIFLATLAIGASAIAVVFPYPDFPGKEIGSTGLKFEYFKAHKDEYDLVFLGPSTTYRDVRPKLFDRVMAERGYSIKSFNLGMDGMGASELDFYVGKILDLKPIHLQWLLLDYPNHLFNNSKKNANSIRNIYWHEPHQTFLASLLIFEARKYNLKKNFDNKFSAFYGNIKSLFIHIFRVGKVSKFWKNCLVSCSEVVSYDEPLNSDLVLQEQGFYALDWEERKVKHKNFLEDSMQKIYQQDLVALQQGKLASTPLKRFSFQIAKDILDRVQKKGIELGFFITPTTYMVHDTLTMVNLYEQKEIPLLFALSDPNTFPNLYQIDRRFDYNHLNERGATEFSRNFADLFAQYLDTHQEGLYGGLPLKQNLSF